MKVLELTNYSAGVCGVFARVKQEAVELNKRGHEVKIFSSNFTKGSEVIAQQSDNIEGIEIKRFPAKKLGGESFMYWNFVEQAIAFNPDVIIAHCYRHPHTYLALKVAKKLGCKCFLVTHAPFVDNREGLLSRISVKVYDFFLGKYILNKFDKVLSITKWETPYLLKLGCKQENIIQIPNGTPDILFNKPIKKGKGIFFLGRVSKIKSLETLIKASIKIKEKIDIIGPAEQDYKNQLIKIIESDKIKNVNFLPSVNNINDKIKTIDKYEILVLTSSFESFGQVLIEAMARGKIVVSSKTPGAMEIIRDGENGFLFNIGDSESLSKKVNEIISMSSKEKGKIIKSATASSKEYMLKNIIDKLERLF